MRKSDRIRLLEMEMLRMQFQIEYLSTAVTLLLEENKVKGPDMDAGKWYTAKLNKDTNCVVKALVDATPISAPALVYKTSFDARAIALS